MTYLIDDNSQWVDNRFSKSILSLVDILDKGPSIKNNKQNKPCLISTHNLNKKNSKTAFNIKSVYLQIKILIHDKEGIIDMNKMMD
jgi:hypothetical protein